MLNAIQLGQNCGLKVSELCLGTMNFGLPGQGHQGDWTLGPHVPDILQAVSCLYPISGCHYTPQGQLDL